MRPVHHIVSTISQLDRSFMARSTVRRSPRLSATGLLALLVVGLALLPGREFARAESAPGAPAGQGAAAQPAADHPATADATYQTTFSPKDGHVPGTVIFRGSYKHTSRGRGIETLGKLALEQNEKKAITAISYLPFMNSTEVAVGTEDNRIARYLATSEPAEGRPGYESRLEIQDGKVLLSQKGGPEEVSGKELPVPPGALFDPNSRPDSYCAANILLRRFAVNPGETKQFDVFDRDNSGKGFAGYKIEVTHKGKEEVAVPAGVFDANHLVLTQLTSADTWFKKRQGHVTDFWVLDNGVIVRILRHREPYELQLAEWNKDFPLPGFKREAVPQELAAGTAAASTAAASTAAVPMPPPAPQIPPPAQAYTAQQARGLKDADLRALVKSDTELCVDIRNRYGSSSEAFLRAWAANRFPLWREAERRDIPEGQTILALCYVYGVEVKPSLAKRIKLFRKAANQGEPTAMYNLAMSYRDGVGVPQDMGEAAKWIWKAGETGYPRAERWLTSLRPFMARSPKYVPPEQRKVAPVDVP